MKRLNKSSYKLIITSRWSPDSNHIITRINNTVQIHKVCDEYGVKPRCKKEHKDFVWDFSFSPNGKKILVGFGGDYSSLWDWYHEYKIKDIGLGSMSRMQEAIIHNTWSPNGQYFACKSKNRVYIFTSETNKFYAEF